MRRVLAGSFIILIPSTGTGGTRFELGAVVVLLVLVSGACRQEFCRTKYRMRERRSQ